MLIKSDMIWYMVGRWKGESKKISIFIIIYIWICNLWIKYLINEFLNIKKIKIFVISSNVLKQYKYYFIEYRELTRNAFASNIFKS